MIYDLLDGTAIRFFVRNKIPITDYIEKIELNAETVLSIDCENLQLTINQSPCARVAVVGFDTGAHQRHSHRNHNSIDVVFHALINIDKPINYAPKALEHCHISPPEHSNKYKSMDRNVVMEKLKVYLENYPIIWLNFGADMDCLKLCGIDIDFIKDLHWYDIQKFYLRDTTDQPIALWWLSRYILFDERQYLNETHSPIIDASNHIKLYRKLNQVMDRSKSIGVNIRDGLIQSNFKTICRLSDYEIMKAYNRKNPI